MHAVQLSHRCSSVAVGTSNGLFVTSGMHNSVCTADSYILDGNCFPLQRHMHDLNEKMLHPSSHGGTFTFAKC